MKENWMYVVNTTYNLTDDKIINLQEVKRKTKLNFLKNISKSYNEMKNKNIKFQENLFAENAQGISKNYHEVINLINFLQTKP